MPCHEIPDEWMVWGSVVIVSRPACLGAAGRGYLYESEIWSVFWLRKIERVGRKAKLNCVSRVRRKSQKSAAIQLPNHLSIFLLFLTFSAKRHGGLSFLALLAIVLPTNTYYCYYYTIVMGIWPVCQVYYTEGNPIYHAAQPHFPRLLLPP